MRRTKTRTGPIRGQALIESCLAIVLVCLVFAGLFQISRLFAAREILDYAAGRAARAKTVGFNEWMVRKSAQVAAIPNGGAMLQPAFTNEDWTLRTKVHTLSSGGLWNWVLGQASPSSAQYSVERVRIPAFLEAANDNSSYNVLNYTNWDSMAISVTASGDAEGSMIQAVVEQEYPLTMPMHRAFYADDDDVVDLAGESYIEEHYSLYLEDLNW